MFDSIVIVSLPHIKAGKGGTVILVSSLQSLIFWSFKLSVFIVLSVTIQAWH